MHVIPTLGQHVPHTPEENRRMFGSIPQRADSRPRLARRLRARRRGLGRVRQGSLRRRGRLADSDRAQPHADGRAVGSDHQRRPRRAARGARLCQSQQELLHRPRRQRLDLRLAHAGRLLRHREQPRQPHHAGAGLLQQGRRRVPRPAARLLRAGRAGPQRQRRNWSTPACTSATIWKPILHAARQSREQNITVFDEPLEKIVCVMQGDEFFSTWVANKAVYRTRMALADGGELIDHRPGPEAVRRAARGRRLHSQVRLLRHAAR